MPGPLPVLSLAVHPLANRLERQSTSRRHPKNQERQEQVSSRTTGNGLSITHRQEPGAPPHTAGETIDLLHQLLLGNHVINLGTAHESVLHIPNMNPLDFFLFWGVAKGQVYTT